MPAKVIVGMQWGDEGKGKIVDVLSEHSHAVVRYQGGPNAGHTVVIDDRTFVLHLVPTGALRKGTICLLGNGVVIDLLSLKKEIDGLEEAGFKLEGRFFISPNAHLILPYHIQVEDMDEGRDPGGKLGTTRRGIGPAYTDKVARTGIRMFEILHPDIFSRKLKENVERLRGAAGHKAKVMADEIFESHVLHAERFRPMIKDVSLLIDDMLQRRQSVLFEGAQGTMLDVDHGTYPFVTSSSTVSGGACTGAGVAPRRIDEVIGVAKAYSTRVGNGPFPTEIHDRTGVILREIGSEYGRTTGRPRRCGWLDIPVLRLSARVNGISSMAITKLDVLDSADTIKMCRAYLVRGEEHREIPQGIPFDEMHPVYEEFPGWKEDTSSARKWEDLPSKAREYLDAVRGLVNVPVSLVSVGSKRDDIIRLS
ncbi:MAG: adenylosuccinate synthase [Candidatus Eisenbacteria bacterium]|nr:adenylosuccinate synthase [Candidatus Eisenbacteria bacterium]